VSYNHTIHIVDDFIEVGTKTIDDRKRLTLGELQKDFKRVRLYKNAAGEILVQPVVEIPVSELWLFKNKESLSSVRKGLKDAAKGKISKLDLKSL